MARQRSFLLILACFFLSGLAGLIYETVWTQQFTLVFGASELAIATVLGAYMAGLAGGAAVARRCLRRIRRPVRLYAILELGIALSALSIPAALAVAERVHVAILGGVEISSGAGAVPSALFYLVVTFAILLVPTGLMGATLPLLAGHVVQEDRDLGSRVGLLYAGNTLGAALGVLFAAFLLLPSFGLGGTVLVAVAVNFAVFLLAAALSSRQPLAREKGVLQEDRAVMIKQKEGERDGKESVFETRGELVEDAADCSTPAGALIRARASWILPMILVSGFVAFSWEVLWTRLLSHLLGGTVYAFGAMLATFLVGISVGAAVASQFATTAIRARRGFVIAQIGIAMCSLGAFRAVELLPGLVDGLQASGASLARAATLAATTLLPGALFMGATFPFAVRILAGTGTGTGTGAEAGSASARVYVWNTVGAIGGAVATGFFLLPFLAIAGTATLMIALSVGLGFAAAWAFRPKAWRLVGVAVAGGLVLLLFLPETPWTVLRTAPMSGRPAHGEVAFYGVGRSATVLLVDEDGKWRLSSNGLPEAAIQPTGSRTGVFTVARWMALLPVWSRPEAESMLIVGLGAALTLGSVPDSIDEIHVVELEPEVVKANRTMAEQRSPDPLSDPRLRLHINDARSALALSSREFDAIVSQPSHPWTSGSSHLFTSEFFSLVRQRLSPRGVFVQWIGLQYVDADLLRTLVATLVEVFPHVEVYQPFPGGGVLFLCGDEPLSDADDAARGYASGAAEWHRMGLFEPLDILVDRLLDDEGSRRFSAGAQLNTDSRNLLKIRSPRILNAPIGGRDLRGVLADFDVLGELSLEQDGIYIVRQLIRRNALDRAGRVADGLVDEGQGKVAAGLVHIASGRPRLGEKMLWEGLDADEPAANEALAGLLKVHRRDASAGVLPTLLQERVGVDEQARAVVEGWQSVAEGDRLAIEEVEPVLRSIYASHPLFDAATGLRMAWRQARGDVTSAREALLMVEPWLARSALAPGLLLRASLAVQAEEEAVARASLREFAEYVSRMGNRTQARVFREQGMELIGRFPEHWRQASDYQRFEARLMRLLEPREGTY